MTIGGLLAVTIHFHFSQLVIPQCNKTVWPLCLAPVGPILHAKVSQPPSHTLKWNVNLQKCGFGFLFHFPNFLKGINQPLLRAHFVNIYRGESHLLEWCSASPVEKTPVGPEVTAVLSAVFTLAQQLQLHAESISTGWNVPLTAAFIHTTEQASAPSVWTSRFIKMKVYGGGLFVGLTGKS